MTTRFFADDACAIRPRAAVLPHAGPNQQSGIQERNMANPRQSTCEGQALIRD